MGATSATLCTLMSLLHVSAVVAQGPMVCVKKHKKTSSKVRYAVPRSCGAERFFCAEST
jgi:hypothetical protein